MFNKQKRILEENKNVLESIEKEKRELLEIKRILEEKCEKVNITNLFVFERNGYYNIVELKQTKIHGTTNRSKGEIVEGYHSELVDIFSQAIVYEKNNVYPIQSKEMISDRFGECYAAFLYSVTSIDKNLLKYVDNMVPKIELQKLFYKLNNVELTNHENVLRKNK